jgi:hypothetical protein
MSGHVTLVKPKSESSGLPDGRMEMLHYDKLKNQLLVVEEMAYPFDVAVNNRHTV